MIRAYRFPLLALLLGLSASLMGVAWAQSPPTTGTPPFGSFGGGPESINLANNNVHWDVPVLAKAGRGGFNFTYDLSYDSSVWGGGVSSGTSGWYPVGNWGWRGITEASTGYLSYTSQQHFACQIWNPDDHKYDRYTYVLYNFSTYGDPYGIPHPINVTLEGSSTPCSNDPNLPSYATGTISDGSGYAYSLQAPPYQGAEYISPASGGSIQPPLGRTGAANGTDRNGNQITVNGSGQFFDTLSSTTPVLTVSGSGTPASPMTFTYTAPSGANAAYTMKYTTYSIQTNFGCTGITDYGTNGNMSANLVSEIDLPDGSKYSFGYEPTPGHSGFVTGRLASVTLPTGGTISYTYLGGNNGIVCADGSTATLTRTTTTDGGTWTYAHSESGTAWTTLITDPQGNQTNMNFQGIYETQRQVSQLINGSQSLLRQWTTCYNTNTSSCNTTAITLPITQRNVTDQYGASGPQCQHIYKYNSVGGLFEQDDYDYPSGTTLLRKTLITYASLGNITAFRQQVTVQNGSGTTVSQTNYNYDETTPTATSGIAQHTSVGGSRGNLTSINYPVSGLTSHFTYYDTGSPNTSQDVNTATTTYNYGTDNTANCQMAFPISVSEPLNMSRSMNWNCTGGVMTQLKDENGQTTGLSTNYTWNDPYFWRPANVLFPDGGETDWTYNSLTSFKTTTKMNSSQSIVTTQLLDGLGRSKEQQLNSDPEGVVYADTTYDALGRVYTVSNPYRSTSDPTYGLTTYGYDALSRPTTITLQDGSVANASYNNNTITTTDPAGKKRQGTTDSLGRPTQMTEDPGGLGYVTTYSYDALSNLTSVTQNGSRQRTFAYDALSRLTSETNPESGTVTYGYDANGNSGDLTSRVAPAPNQTGSSTVTTMYSWDLLHRLIQKSYSDGTTRTVFFAYDQTSAWGNTLTNTLGRLTERWNGQSCCATAGAEIFSYDPMGRVVLNTQYTPAMSYRPMSYTYDLAGNMATFTDGVGETYTQTFDAASRVTQLNSSWVDSQHPAVLAATDSTVGYYPFGALRKMNLGNNLTQTYAFNKDLQPCRINANSSASVLGTCADAIPSGNLQDFNYGFNLGSSDNGNVMTWTGTGQQSFNRTYGYDSLNRLSTLSSPSDPNGCTGLSWTTDPWGNRTDQTVTGGSCRGFHQTINAQNRLANSPYQYDAAGNLTADGSHTYAYDAENLLTSVDGGATATYLYDATGRRVQKAVASGQTQYIYDLGGNVASELDQNLTWKNAYVRMNGAIFAQYTVGSPRTAFILSDHLGSTRLLTDMNQSVVQNLDYLPFGELNSTDTGISTHEFTGDEQDAETALAHTLFRQYSSVIGRWMTPDPAGLAAVNPSNPQSWNRYSYALNNSLALVDSLGLTPACYTVQNQQPGQSQDSKPGGPSADEADPGFGFQMPQSGCLPRSGGGGNGDGFSLDYGYSADDSGMGMAIPIGGGDLQSQIFLMNVKVTSSYSWGITSWEVLCGLSCNEIPNYGWIPGSGTGAGFLFLPSYPDAPIGGGTSGGVGGGGPVGGAGPVSANRPPTTTQPTDQCAAEAQAAAAPYWNKATTPPSAGDIVGGGIISGLAKVFKASSPVAIALGFANVFRGNIGNAVLTPIIYDATYTGCKVGNGTFTTLPYPPS
jgi:RHS repeat-associated protein